VTDHRYPDTCISCAQCTEAIWMSADRNRDLRRSSATFYCIWGHSNFFPTGPSEADRLKRERDRLKQENARLEERAAAAERAEELLHHHAAYLTRKAAAARGQVTRLKNRAKAGLCPCCNRSFPNLWAHMTEKHPEWEAEEVDLGAKEADQ
jgi:hypothetical protein